MLNFIFVYDYPPTPLLPPKCWRSSANKQIDRNEQNAFQVLVWMLPSVSVSWMAELGKFINCQSQFSDVSTISSLQPHYYVPPLILSTVFKSYNTYNESISISIYMSFCLGHLWIAKWSLSDCSWSIAGLALTLSLAEDVAF